MGEEQLHIVNVIMYRIHSSNTMVLYGIMGILYHYGIMDTLYGIMGTLPLWFYGYFTIIVPSDLLVHINHIV